MKNNLNLKFLASLILLVTSSVLTSIGQTNQNLTPQQLAGQLNTITTSVPFLMISPDSRAGGMGDLGVATSADANSIHWNAAKMTFAEKKMGVSLSYTPWLRNLVPDINLSYLSGYTKIDDKQAFGASLRYFSLGNIQFTNLNGENIGNYTPNEWSVDGAYSRKLSKNFSVGVALRFIWSGLSLGLDMNQQTRAGIAFAGDISAYYNKDVKVANKKATLNIGANISNIGNKISYTRSGQSNFIPTNLRLGSQLKFKLDDYNSLAIIAEVSKLLVPTFPVYERDSAGRVVFNPGTGRPSILAGKDPSQLSPIQGIISSFSDAPGGWREELKEIIYQFGLEYWYNNQFALRTGYFHEAMTKGGRQYATLGLGLKYNVFDLSFSYLIPTKALVRSPLENTLRFTLSFGLDAFKSNDNQNN